MIAFISLLGVLVVLVMAHECGHYFTARAAGVKIEEVALFFPPRLLSIKRGETRYSINAVPLGGYVKMVGEEDPKMPGSLASKRAWVRVLVLASGSLMNAILPVLLFSIAVMVPHNVVAGEVVVNDVAANSPAARAGIRAGDTVLAIDGDPVRNIGEVHRDIQLKLGQEVDITVEHPDATRETLPVVPRWRTPAGEGATGITIRVANAVTVRESEPFWRAVPRGVKESIDTYVLFKNAVIGIFIGEAPATVAGPVGIAQITGEAARAGFSYLLQFAAFFSINLAIINIFPLPALDGGRIAFVVLEWLRRGRRVSPRIEGIVHTVGFFALIAAMVAITYQDILRIITGESLIP